MVTPSKKTAVRTVPIKKDSSIYYIAVGRRKTAVARVWLFLERGGIMTINGKTLEQYFPSLQLRKIAVEAQAIAGLEGACRVTAKITGGGAHAQAEALRHAISRAILKVDSTHRKALKREGFLKRDPRMKERRKFGLKKARKAPQWAKR